MARIVHLTNSEAAQRHLTELIAIDSAEGLRAAIQKAKAEQGRGLYDRASALLETVSPAERDVRVGLGFPASGGSPWQKKFVRQLVVPFGDGADKRELILANVYGQHDFVVGSENATVYIRRPDAARELSTFAPGQQLFGMDLFGTVDGPLTDPVLVNGYLDMFATYAGRFDATV